MIRARPKAVSASVALAILAVLVLYRLVLYSPDVVVVAATDGVNRTGNLGGLRV